MDFTVLFVIKCSKCIFRAGLNNYDVLKILDTLIFQPLLNQSINLGCSTHRQEKDGLFLIWIEGDEMDFEMNMQTRVFANSFSTLLIR